MINNDVLQDALDHQHHFQNALPYRHVMIDHFLDESQCENLLHDFPAFDKKFAMNEMGEVGLKAVVEKLSALSPTYKRFYQYINSDNFLQQMSELTGIPDLIADATLFGGGTHENRDGQSLDVHIDFNIDERRMLYRRLNLLVYLNKEWEESWGGYIDLHSNPRVPVADKVTSFAPLFNRAVIFETNEYSWHGFRTIKLPEDKKHLSRKSLSIYLYTKDRPVEEVVAPHSTFYVSRPLAAHIQPGLTLSTVDYQHLQVSLASRDGLLHMYQDLLIEKEQRLREFMTANQAGTVDHKVVLSSRSWKLIMALHHLKYWVTSKFRT